VRAERRGASHVTRVAVLVVALVFIIGFAILTLHAVAQQGLTLASVISVFIVALLGFGIVGALRDPPRK
jgi:hypothetical protein